MVAMLDDPSFVEYINVVGQPDCRETMRDEHYRPAREQFAHRREKSCLGAGVEGGGRLV